MASIPGVVRGRWAGWHADAQHHHRAAAAAQGNRRGAHRRHRIRRRRIRRRGALRRHGGARFQRPGRRRHRHFGPGMAAVDPGAAKPFRHLEAAAARSRKRSERPGAKPDRQMHPPCVYDVAQRSNDDRTNFCSMSSMRASRRSAIISRRRTSSGWCWSARCRCWPAGSGRRLRLWSEVASPAKAGGVCSMRIASVRSRHGRTAHPAMTGRPLRA